MDEQVEQHPHSAITSYSGYIYQGKIAVLHCLRLIEEQPEDSKTLKLQIESIDDFAILFADNTCKSLHQVKARKDRLFSDYQPDIIKQQEKARLHNGAEALFHVSLPLKLIPAAYDEDYTPVKFYIYYDENKQAVNHCKLCDVDAFIENQIKKTYSIVFPEEAFKTNIEYLRKSRQYLEDIVLKHVIDVHREIQQSHVKGPVQRAIAAKRNVPFEDIYEILTKNLNDIASDESYYHYLLLKDAGKYFHEFCLKINDEDKLLKLNYYISKINKINSATLTKFIRSILPHKKVGFDNILQYKDNTFNSEDIRIGLLNVLEQLVKADFDSSSNSPSFFFWKNEDEYYYPTAIHRAPDDAEVLCVDIIEASIEDDVNFLYESGRLINRHIDCKSIFSNIAVDSRSSFNLEDEYRDELEANKINSFKNVSLISLNEAKRVIND